MCGVWLLASNCGGPTEKWITEGAPAKIAGAPFQHVKKEEKSILLQGELEGAKPASNQIKRPEKPAQQAFGERSENFCEAKVTAL